jgi:hypothetical protein
MDTPYTAATTHLPRASVKPNRARLVDLALVSQVISICFGMLGLFASGAYKNITVEIGALLGTFLSIFIGLTILAWLGASWPRFVLLLIQVFDVPRRVSFILLFFPRHSVLAWINLGQCLFGVLVVVLLFAGPSRSWFRAVREWRKTRV